ncbi:MAG: zinc ribbon domain-containing protein [Planctomycetes bacterium]|nr:zinc ribbon domain-containing protein [Planctomycetota bacterium]
MPFYEYRCDECHAEFQTFVKTMDPACPRCPKCRGKKVSRKQSVFGVGSSQPAQSAQRCSSCQQSGSCPMAQ